MQTLSEIRQLLAERGLRPKHRLGQNFLHDKNQLAKLIEAAGVRPGDVVLEVGPGTGTLTEALLEAGAEVIACEIDQGMAGIIEERLARWMTGGASDAKAGRLVMVRGDALVRQRQLNPELVRLIASRRFKLVANLPYQIASPLISTLLIDHADCTGQFVTIQREVADRLMAKPSTKAYGPLTVIVQAWADVQRISTLSPSCFWPEPEVTSAMVAITPNDRGQALHRDFARFVTDLFTKRRKQLGGIIGRAHSAWSRLQEQGITPDLRPEALRVEQIIALWKHTASHA